jgi:hypothetical protein
MTVRYVFAALIISAPIVLGQRPEVTSATSSVDPFTRQRWYAAGDSVTFFGKNLAAVPAFASYQDQAETLGGVSVRYLANPDSCEPYIKSVSGQEDPAKVALCGDPLTLTYVSPGQINAVIPWTVNLTGQRFSGNSADYLGTIVLVKNGMGYIRLGRMYPDSDAFWNIWPFDVAGDAARPALAVLGYHMPFTGLNQPHAVSAEKNTVSSVRFGAVTHPNGALVTTSNPVRNGGRLTVWLTGLGELMPCGAAFCAGETQAANLPLFVGLSLKGSLYYFPTKAEFIGSTRDFPWLQQINLHVSLCGTALPAQPIPIDARLYFGWNGANGASRSPGSPLEILLPLTIDANTAGDTKGFVFQPISGLAGFGSWRPNACPVF